MQLDLFNSIFIGYNKAIKALLNLDADGARCLLRNWEAKARANRDLTMEWRLIDFLSRGDVKRAMDSAPEEALRYWDEMMEGEYRKSPLPEGIIAQVRRRYFQVLSKMVMIKTQEGQGGVDTPMVLCCLRAGLYKEVVRLGKAALKASPTNSRIIGYVADAYWELKERALAKSYYLRGLLEDPRDIDTNEVRCPEISRLLSEPILVLEEAFGETMDLDSKFNVEWAAAVGLLVGFFNVPTLSDQKSIKSQWERLRSNDVTIPKGIRFAIWMILSEQGMDLLSRNDISLGEARAAMKALNPQLFNIYMRQKDTGSLAC